MSGVVQRSVGGSMQPEEVLQARYRVLGPMEGAGCGYLSDDGTARCLMCCD